MRFAYDEDKMELLHVHRVQDILHGLVFLESAHVKRVVFEDTDNPRLFDNLTTWELPKLFKNVTGADPDQSWAVPVVRELLAQRIEEMKPRLADDQELDRQIAAVEADLRQKVCPFYRYALGAKVPRTESAAAAPLCLPKPFTAAQVAQAPAAAVRRAAALAAAKVPVSTVAPNAPWAKNNACAPSGGDATVKDQTTEASIKQEMDMAKTPEEIAAEKAAKEAEAAAKKAAAATAKAAKEAEKAAAKAAKEAEAVAAKAAAATAKAAKEAEKAAAKAAKEAEAVAAKAAKDKAKADAEAAKAANKLPEQNGITRPKPETLCGKIWSVLDGISTKNGAPASIAEAKEHPDVVGMADATIRTQYARWRKFYGVTGRVDPPKPAEATPPETAPAAPAA